jgi:hypothetical protein
MERKHGGPLPKQAWTYHNHRPINFDEEEAEISAILEEPEDSPVIAGPSHLPTPYTPGTSLQQLRAASPSPSCGRSTARTPPEPRAQREALPRLLAQHVLPVLRKRNTPSPPVQAPRVGSNPPHPQTTSPIAIPVAQVAPPALVPPVIQRKQRLQYPQ